MYPTFSRVLALLAGMLLVFAAPRAAVAQHEHGQAASAAPVAVTGQALSSEAEPLAGAIVQLVHGTGQGRHIMASGLTDAAGRFALRTPGGSYTLQISFLGHSPYEQLITVGAAGLSIGSIRLQAAALALDAIAATAERERVQLRGGATIVEAAGAAAAAGGSVADLLRTVPGVEIDANGRITMRGSTSVLVLLNGRRVPLTDDALIAFLKQMPATALERIEAGTTASARLDADGMAGVVNLVFSDDARRTDGMRSVAASVATEDHYMASASASGSSGLLSWDAGYSFSGMRPLTASWTLRESLLAGDPVRFSEQESRAHARHRLHSVMGGTTVHLPAAALGLRGAYSWMSGAYRNATDFMNTAPAGELSSYLTSSILEHTIPAGEVSAHLDWRLADRGDVRLATEVRTSFVQEDFHGDYAHGDGHTFLSTTMAARHDEHVVGSDLSFSLGSTRVDVGQKVQLRGISADYDTRRGHDVGIHSFRYDDRVLAGYVAAHRAFGPVAADVGMRAESERTTIALDDRSSHSKLRLFPSTSVAWKPGGDDDLQYRFSWGRRINRPDAASLNPYSMGEDDMNDIVGNPTLRPEIADQLELGIERSAPGMTMQLMPFLRVTRDPIRPLKTVTESGRATTTLENLTRTRSWGLDGTVRTRLGDLATAMIAGSVYSMETEGESYHNDGVYATARLNLDVRLADRTTLQLNAWRRGAQAVEQGRILPTTSSEVALTQAFGTADRGRVTLRIADPFESDRLAFRIGDATFLQESSRRISRPLATLFMSWTVGGTPRESTPVSTGQPARIF